MKFKVITILICSILFVGCQSEKIESPALEQETYKSDYSVENDNVITLKDLEKELNKSGVKLEKYGDVSESSLGEYYLLVDQMNVNILTKISAEKVGEEVIQSIRLSPAEAKGVNINQTPFFNNLLMQIGETQIKRWLTSLEEEYKELEEKEVARDSEEIIDILASGRNYLTFLGEPSHNHKVLEIAFRNWEDIPKELRGAAAELENQDFVTIDYAKGFKGDFVYLASLKYHLIDSGEYRYREELAESLVDTENLVAYKVMHDPSNNFNYSAQLYGFMPVDSDDTVKVEEMLGIDTISRVMDMSWDDFTQVTGAINQELTNLKEPGSQAEFRPEYNAEGRIAGHKYELYAESYRGYYKFTVLLEKI